LDGTTYSSLAGGPTANPLEKTGGQICGGNVFQLSGVGGAECTDELALWPWGNSAALWWKLVIALPWRNWKWAEIDSLPGEKLSSTSQTCPVSGRDWWLHIYQVLMWTLLKTCPHRGPILLRKPRLKHLELIAPNIVW
jgi:hypothetical protein